MNNRDVPPNQSEWLDSKCETEVRLLKDRLKKVNGLSVELEEEIKSAQGEIRHLRGALRRQRIALDDLYASRSWKMTQPVRAVSGLVKSMFSILFPSLLAVFQRHPMANSSVKRRIRLVIFCFTVVWQFSCFF